MPVTKTKDVSDSLSASDVDLILDDTVKLIVGLKSTSGEAREELRNEILEIIAIYENSIEKPFKWSEDSGDIRRGTIIDQLSAIEKACNNLATAFDSSGQATLNVFTGMGLNVLRGSYPSPTTEPHVKVLSDKSDKISELRDLTRLYKIPAAPAQSTLSLAQMIAEGGTPNLWSAANHLSWSEAIRALGLLARERRANFEEFFRPATERQKDIIHRGPNGLLSPSERGLKARRKRETYKIKKAEDRRGAPTAKEWQSRGLSNNPGDKGGPQNAYEDMWGHPRWEMVSLCYEFLSRNIGSKHITTYDGGLFKTLATNIHECATKKNNQLDFKEYINRSVRIMRAKENFITSTRPDNLECPIRQDQEVSLMLASNLGIDPDWLP